MKQQTPLVWLLLLLLGIPSLGSAEGTGAVNEGKRAAPGGGGSLRTVSSGNARFPSTSEESQNASPIKTPSPSTTRREISADVTTRQFPNSESYPSITSRPDTVATPAPVNGPAGHARMSSQGEHSPGRDTSSREERSPGGEEDRDMSSDRPWEVLIGGSILANGLGVFLVLLIRGLVFRERRRRLRGRARGRRQPGSGSRSGSGSPAASRASSARSASSGGSQNKDSLVVSITNAFISRKGNSTNAAKYSQRKDSVTNTDGK